MITTPALCRGAACNSTAEKTTSLPERYRIDVTAPPSLTSHPPLKAVLIFERDLIYKYQKEEFIFKRKIEQ